MLKDATLTKTQKNAVLERIVRASMRPENFEWVADKMPEYDMGMKTDDYSVSMLRHRSSGYFFTFGEYRLRYSPGPKTKVTFEDHNLSWNTKFRYLDEWLQAVRHEDEAPDLWNVVQGERALADAAAETTDNAPFTPQERTEISKRLEEIREYLVEARQIEARQAAIVNGQLAYLRSAADRVGRKDWLNIALSVLVGITLYLALPPENAGGLMRLANALFGWIWTKTAALP